MAGGSEPTIDHRRNGDDPPRGWSTRSRDWWYSRRAALITTCSAPAAGIANIAPTKPNSSTPTRIRAVLADQSLEVELLDRSPDRTLALGGGIDHPGQIGDRADGLLADRPHEDGQHADHREGRGEHDDRRGEGAPAADVLLDECHRGREHDREEARHSHPHHDPGRRHDEHDGRPRSRPRPRPSRRSCATEQRTSPSAIPARRRRDRPRRGSRS